LNFKAAISVSFFKAKPLGGLAFLLGFVAITNLNTVTGCNNTFDFRQKTGFKNRQKSSLLTYFV